MGLKKYQYMAATMDTEWKIISTETKFLTLEYRVGKLSDDEYIENPTGNPDAFFYEIIIDGNGKQLQTFHPMEVWFQPMTEDEAQERLDAHIEQIVTLYNATEYIEKSE